MKLLSILAHATLLSAAAFLLGLAFDVQAFLLFSLAVTAPLLLIAFRDYLSPAAAPARWRTPPIPARNMSPRRKYKLPFAA